MNDQPTRPPLRRLHPAPAGPTTVAEAYTVARSVPADRPWVGLCMVASLDGSVVIDGSSGGLGNPNDLDVLITLRAIADVVVVGAGTAGGEGYGPPRKPGQRIAVATNRGSVDLDSPLFTSGAGFVLAPHDADIDERRVQVLRAGHGRLDLRDAISRLHEMVPDVAYVQAEGGPTLNAALTAADLLDELNLTLSPRFVGADGPRLVSGGDQVNHDFELAHLLLDDDGFLFGRWLRRR